MEEDCKNCGHTLTLEEQKAGTRTSSDDKKDGAFYTTKCAECGEDNTEAVRRLIQNN